MQGLHVQWELCVWPGQRRRLHLQTLRWAPPLYTWTLRLSWYRRNLLFQTDRVWFALPTRVWQVLHLGGSALPNIWRVHASLPGSLHLHPHSGPQPAEQHAASVGKKQEHQTWRKQESVLPGSGVRRRVRCQRSFPARESCLGQLLLLLFVSIFHMFITAKCQRDSFRYNPVKKRLPTGHFNTSILPLLFWGQYYQNFCGAFLRISLYVYFLVVQSDWIVKSSLFLL